jgi:hypothetical protein
VRECRVSVLRDRSGVRGEPVVWFALRIVIFCSLLRLGVAAETAGAAAGTAGIGCQGVGGGVAPL